MQHAAPTGRSIAVFAAAKTVANTALRWAPPFLPTLERAFGATTAQLTTALGVAEAGGLSTLAIGRRLDRGQERAIATIGLGVVAVAALVALLGTTFTFAISAFLVVVGVANLTAAGHAWLGHRVPYERRARAIGLFETSWALSLLVGAPILAGLIAVFGWRGPYVAIVVASLLAGLLLLTRLDDGSPAEPVVVETPPRAETERPPDTRPDSAAWLIIGGSAFTAMAGLAVFAISGAWLDDAFGVPTSGLGFVAMGFGAIELTASVSSATFADRLGKRRTTLAALLLLAVGIAVMAMAGSSLHVGLVGLLAFLCGFEYAIVTSFSLVTEAMPAARGMTISVSNAMGTIARAAGVVASGWLYEAHGIRGTVTLSAVATGCAIACFLAGGRSRTHVRV